jgi:hypothetical protein
VKNMTAVVLALALGWTLGPAAADEPRDAAGTRAGAGAPAGQNAAASQARKGTMDRLELGTTAITGNSELPKVMYVVPWKQADLGDLGGKPLNSLVDEILAPVDRDVFRREISYFGALEPARKAEAETSVTAGERAP